MFVGTGINSTTEGRKHLGAALGSRSYREQYVGGQVEDWVGEVTRMAEFSDLSHKLVTQHSHLDLDIGGRIL